MLKKFGRLIRRREAAAILGVSSERVRQLALEGRLRAVELAWGGDDRLLRLYLLEDVLALAEARRAARERAKQTA